MNFSNFKLSFAIDYKSFAKINYRPFIAGIIVVVIVKFFTLFGFEPSTLFSSGPRSVEKFDSVRIEENR